MDSMLLLYVKRSDSNFFILPNDSTNFYFKWCPARTEIRWLCPVTLSHWCVKSTYITKISRDNVTEFASCAWQRLLTHRRARIVPRVWTIEVCVRALPVRGPGVLAVCALPSLLPMAHGPATGAPRAGRLIWATNGFLFLFIYYF